ncbi:MAG: Ribosomal large subunit pseudouridine synthase C [Firmicutes bacterium ADurb.Bin182]|nr:MAG: Ribosomal large subunit pseudouridine synthase C [Firmicutes bacterium ADurb.Bin182]
MQNRLPKILYEDNHLLVVIKPVNMPVQADSSGDPDLLSMLKEYVKVTYNKPGEAYLGLVHRLDRPVGGVMVFARTSKAAKRLSEQLSSKTAVKKYAAVVMGEVDSDKELTDYLLKDENTNTVRIVPPSTPGAKRAQLRYRVFGREKGMTLLDVELLTGRPHQIRVQLSGAGFPIFGDARYNRGSKPGQQIALWAYELAFAHPVKKEKMRFTGLPAGGIWDEFNTGLRSLICGIEVLFSDDNIIAVNKRPGECVAAADGDCSVQERLSSEFGAVYPVHRLDFNTQGIVLFARNPAAKEALDRAIRERSVKKIYRLIVKGHFEKKAGVKTAYAVKDPEGSKVTVSEAARPGSKEMITRYRVLKEFPDSSLLEVELITGRTHQIRAHMAYLGHPVLGDDKYGDRAFNKAKNAGRQVLQAIRAEPVFEKDSPLSYLNGRIFETRILPELRV